MYQAALAAGAIQAGSFAVAASGGTDVGAFQSGVQIGSGIQITTALPGTVFPCNKAVTINWTGGVPNSWVTASQVSQTDAYTASYSIVPVCRTAWLRFPFRLMPQALARGPTCPSSWFSKWIRTRRKPRRFRPRDCPWAVAPVEIRLQLRRIRRGVGGAFSSGTAGPDGGRKPKG